EPLRPIKISVITEKVLSNVKKQLNLVATINWLDKVGFLLLAGPQGLPFQSDFFKVYWPPPLGRLFFLFPRALPLIAKRGLGSKLRKISELWDLAAECARRLGGPR